MAASVTGSASWAYKTGIENIIGIHKRGNKLILDPRVPSEWQNFTIRYRHGSSMYVIYYERTAESPAPYSTIDLVDDGQTHEILIH